MTTRSLARIVSAAVCTASLVGAEQQVDVGPAVSLDPEIACWSYGAHPTVTAAIEPDAPIARLYFRCSLYPDYYFVDLSRASDGYTAILPQATEECPSVYYYLEAVSGDFASSRTPERLAEVSSANACQRNDPLVAFFTGKPKIILGATSAFAPQMAPGFSAAGIAGFITAGGVASGAAGAGLSSTAIAGIGGAAAAGTVVAVSSAGGSNEEPSPAPSAEPAPAAGGGAAGSPPTPPVSTPTPTPPSVPDTKPVACVSTEPQPAVVGIGEPIRLDASCSTADSAGDSGDRIAQYLWELSDGRQKTGRVVTAVFRNAGVFEITLTVVDGGTGFLAREDSTTFEVTVEDRVDACFTSQDVDPGTGCNVRTDASCSTGNIVRYDWIFSDGFGNYPFTGRTVTKDWGTCPLPTTVTLTVTSEGGATDSVTMPVFVNYQRTPSDGARTELIARLDDDPSTRPVRLVLNETESATLTGGGSQRFSLKSRIGVNRLVVHHDAGDGAAVLVTLDFSATSQLAPGSLRVREGAVAASGPRLLVFRVSGRASLEYVLESAAYAAKNR